ALAVAALRGLARLTRRRAVVARLDPAARRATVPRCGVAVVALLLGLDGAVAALGATAGEVLGHADPTGLDGEADRAAVAGDAVPVVALLGAHADAVAAGRGRAHIG